MQPTFGLSRKTKRDKQAKKVKDVVKFNIGFTIVKNITTESWNVPFIYVSPNLIMMSLQKFLKIHLRTKTAR